MRPTILLSTIVFASLFAAMPARAAESPADVKSADTLFQSAKQAMDQGDLATACMQFANSQRLDPAPGTLLNLGECEARSGKLASALAHYQEGRRQLAAGDFRIEFADQRIAELVRRVPRLVLQVRGAMPEGLRVTRDGESVPLATLGTAARLDPGKHVVVVESQGRADARREVVLREGEEQTLEIAPGALLGSPPVRRVDRARGRNTQRTWGLVAAGAGVVGLGVGTAFGLKSKATYDDAQDHCPAGPATCDWMGVQGGRDAHSQATLSTVAFVGGGALLAVGAVLYFTAPKAGQVAVGPTVGSSGTGLMAQGAW